MNTMNQDTKSNIIFWVMLAGVFYWMFYGHQMITDSDSFELFISKYRSQTVFSFGSLVIAITVLASFLYPPIIWSLICFEIIDRGIIKESLFNKKSWYLWFAPFVYLLLLALCFYSELSHL
jgi:hypothetical protein